MSVWSEVADTTNKRRVSECVALFVTGYDLCRLLPRNSLHFIAQHLLQAPFTAGNTAFVLCIIKPVLTGNISIIRVSSITTHSDTTSRVLFEMIPREECSEGACSPAGYDKLSAPSDLTVGVCCVPTSAVW